MHSVQYKLTKFIPATLIFRAFSRPKRNVYVYSTPRKSSNCRGEGTIAAPFQRNPFISALGRQLRFSAPRVSDSRSSTPFFTRDMQNASRVIAMARASVCPSVHVRLSVTLLYCAKTVQTRITKSSLCMGSPEDSSLS